MAYVSKIKDTNENILDIKSRVTSAIFYGRCDSTSTATVFTATVDGLTQLYDGVSILLKNGVVTSKANFTININNLGAKPAYSNMAAATREETIFNVNYTMLFIYDQTRVEGGCWICYRGYDSNSNDTGYYIRHSYAVLPVSDTARYYKLYFTSADNTKWVPSSVHSANNATAARPVNQRPINPFGKIVYTSASTNYTAGSNLAVSGAWEQYPFTLGYAFNRTGAALTLTYPAPVYIKCAPQTDGSAIIDEDIPYVQALPTSADGKIYIFLGIAYNSTSVELYQDHPVYYHDGVSVKPWPGTMILGEEPLYSENSNPYKFRQIETDGIANKELLEKIVGGSLTWNQAIADRQHFTNVSTTDTLSYMRLALRNYTSPYNNYFYLSPPSIGLYTKIFDGGSGTTGTALLHNGETRNVWVWSDTSYNILAGHKYFFTMNILSADPTTVNGVSIDNIQLIDLTQMLGTTIADYIYSLDTATAGAGVAWLKQYINIDSYHPYDAGTMKHVEDLQSHDTVGFNQWDEQWESGDINIANGNKRTDPTRFRSVNFIPVIPHQTYYFKSSYQNTIACFYDANKQWVSSASGVGYVLATNRAITIPNWCHYMMFYGGGTTYNHDICINLSDPQKNGTYEPYQKRSYSLDPSVVLRGYPMLVDGRLKYYGDEYLPSGTINRRYNILDLGSLDYSKSSIITNAFVAIYNMPTDFPLAPSTTVIPKWVNSKGYAIMSNTGIEGASVDKAIAWRVSSSNKGIIIRDSAYSTFYNDNDMASFKAAMTGMYLVYEKDTPTTEQAEPFRQLQICDTYGTQEFVTTSIVPVGHLTRYPKNLIALTEQISDTISVSPTTTTPIMDGTASVGTEKEYARGDHIHPTDTTRQATLVSGTNIKTINSTSLLGSGDISIQSYWHYNSTNDTIELVFPNPS